MTPGNYPDGISRRDWDHIEGIIRCSSCGRIIPEDVACPKCDSEETSQELAAGGDMVCRSCGHQFPVDECPGGCPEPDYDAIRERQEEDRADRIREEWP